MGGVFDTQESLGKFTISPPARGRDRRDREARWGGAHVHNPCLPHSQIKPWARGQEREVVLCGENI